MKPIHKILLIVPAIGLVFSSCSPKPGNEGETNNSNQPLETAAPASKVQSVEVVNPKKQSFNAETIITGKAMPNQKVMLYAMEGGFVKSIRKDIGDYVRKGEVIAELSNPELPGILAHKKVLRDGKKITYDRLESIRQKTPAITPLQAVDDAKTEYLALEAEIKAIQTRINMLVIRAPFSGTITRRMVDPGALVQSGLTESNPQALVEIQETSPIRLTIPLPETDIAAVQKGMEVMVNFPDLQGSAFPAKISRSTGALDPESGTMQVEIDLENEKGVIKPGMYAKVQMALGSRKDVLSLPVTSQVMYQNQATVLVVDDGVVSRVAIRKGLSNKDYFEVLNTEITEKSMVIVQGKGLVKPGETVNPVNKSQQP